MAKYEWTDVGASRNFMTSRVDAQAAGEELERIAEKKPLTPDLIVQRARSKASPLHNGFEWNDAIAAETQRKEQARGLLQGIRIVNEEGKPVRAFFNVVNEQDGRIYVTRELAGKVENYRLQVIADALRLLRQAQARLADIEGLEKEHRAIDRVITKVAAKHQEIKEADEGKPQSNGVIRGLAI